MSQNDHEGRSDDTVTVCAMNEIKYAQCIINKKGHRTSVFILMNRCRPRFNARRLCTARTMPSWDVHLSVCLSVCPCVTRRYSIGWTYNL